MTLLGLTARALTDMTASVTAFSFELLRSEDPVTRAAARKMIDRMMSSVQAWTSIGDCSHNSRVAMESGRLWMQPPTSQRMGRHGCPPTEGADHGRG